MVVVPIAPQKILVEAAQVPERTSYSPPKAAPVVSWWAVAVAVNEYHTSLAVLTPKPQPAVGARLWVAPNTVPLTGVAHEALTASATACRQLSFAAGVGLVVNAPAFERALLPLVPPQFCVT